MNNEVFGGNQKNNDLNIEDVVYSIGFFTKVEHQENTNETPSQQSVSEAVEHQQQSVSEAVEHQQQSVSEAVEHQQQSVSEAVEHQENKNETP